MFTLQRQLNRITKDYPFLGLLTVDGIFGRKMTETVKKFQKQFNLTADGVVGRSTWYKISYIYVSVKDLAELTSEGETFSGTLLGRLMELRQQRPQTGFHRQRGRAGAVLAEYAGSV